jgi:trk system potassium uptake protein TrkH
VTIRNVGRVLGFILIFIGLFMVTPAIFSLLHGEDDLFPILISAGLTIALGGIMTLVFRAREQYNGHELMLRDSFAIVVLGWALISALGALPFYLSGYIPTYTDAFFETMSGFTTTGATILGTVEDLPRGLLFWRSLTHWLGGMGIIVLSIAILPLTGVGGTQLYKAEIPGPNPDKITPRVRQTAAALWKVYVLLTGMETLLLFTGGLNIHEALCQSFGTMATGGFSTRTASIAAFDSLFVEAVIIAFMLLAGMNFSLHFYGLKGKPSVYWKSEEFRFYLIIIGAFTALLTLNTWLSGTLKPGEALRHSLFQTVSITTTTGYTTTDFGTWSTAAQLMLLFLMFVGGCAGSTGGSIKVLRMMIIFKQGRAELKKLLHPRAVIPVRIDGKGVQPSVVINIIGFMFLYFGLLLLCTLIMALMGMDIISAFSAVTASLGNIGPGLGSVGPASSFQHIPSAGKWLLSFCMLAGRLEIYTVLVLFTRDFWKK